MNWHDIDRSALNSHKVAAMTRMTANAWYYFPDEVGIG
jgi:hypothetical protein